MKEINLGWISVSNYSQAKKFFTETLGLKIKEEAAEHKWLELSGTDDTQCSGFTLGLCEQNDSEKDLIRAGQNAVITFTVDDIESTKKNLEHKGVKFVDEILEIPGHVKMVSFIDQDKNTFQLVQELKK